MKTNVIYYCRFTLHWMIRLKKMVVWCIFLDLTG